MGDIDPESEALIRQLHRELNGLTRSTRRAAVSFPPVDANRRDIRENKSRGGSKDTGRPYKRKVTSSSDESDSDDSDRRQSRKQHKPTRTTSGKHPLSTVIAKMLSCTRIESYMVMHRIIWC